MTHHCPLRHNFLFPDMAFIFEDLGTNAWTQTAVLTPSDLGGGSFGMYVSVTSTTALASHRNYPNAYGSGP
jgi:hypothetical protein